ncbi:hypothetical protein HQ45_00495 [Porphyromonas crevioricanis]|uniref:Uncharacterized protein n=1 Tax=Porphyromonas crevioricanis JCM 15906 TaxID=1305617 RepID=T1DSI8_9PORP|nr:hypothetical protein [Porphyromonas crevioricanis]KGN91293.1 hypothetical protein HQ45_00495 [Porphyromonas crevioricanis]GAD05730.1 hypothetical protein PORCRE_1437 [Porphyromonas crevioricanis JCM 15906]SKA00969.1 hypothetical protein SAMN02745203_01579 [Porphyromonas crevioricanis]
MEESNNSQSHTQMSLEEYKKAVLDCLNERYSHSIEENRKLVMEESEDYLMYLRDNYTPNVAAVGMHSNLL